MTADATQVTNLAPEIPPWHLGADVPVPLRLYSARVPATWIDYHGHMSETYYLLAMSEAIDPFFTYIGCDAAYRAAGASLYSVSWRLDFHAEVHEGDRLEVDTVLLNRDRKRLHVLHLLRRAEGTGPAATGEQVLVHVDIAAGRATDMPDNLATAASAVSAAHSGLSCPATVGQGLTLTR
ncbi:MAG: 4-hydroxybenzoyl-CoA thioesterase [Boseongicola sp. SB0664_bin_43]|uniref:4-hydroxybenzoyl-CoA thioesterase n=1 Tax=Boseongicola sp. SB0664_bin_43 TaxID=2604844 RepID=A0A6B0XY40_9RHOB|nr:4-hydroxybenzoyl-CoA thioesterase [Boseongicola sp. SB0664_bin_43]MYK30776.1 4-hydroxybenzoyl-CoA thioesterase [Boseongicola sp. SB0670_bin_30]